MEEKWEVCWGQEMDRPQCGGMERVSLITVLQEKKKKHRKDRQTQKKGDKNRETANPDDYLLVVSREVVLKMLIQYEFYKTVNQDDKCVSKQIIPLWTGPISAGPCVRAGCRPLITVTRSDHKHTHMQGDVSHIQTPCFIRKYALSLQVQKSQTSDSFWIPPPALSFGKNV